MYDQSGEVDTLHLELVKWTMRWDRAEVKEDAYLDLLSRHIETLRNLEETQELLDRAERENVWNQWAMFGACLILIGAIAVFTGHC